MKAWTDYPFTQLQDEAGKNAPVREIEVLERLALNVLKQLGEEAAPQAAVPKIDRESAAEKIAIEVADNCGNWLTVVYRDIQPGDEARAIVEHPKASALSWSHALRDRDTAIAAQTKQGEQANG